MPELCRGPAQTTCCFGVTDERLDRAVGETSYCPRDATHSIRFKGETAFHLRCTFHMLDDAAYKHARVTLVRPFPLPRSTS